MIKLVYGTGNPAKLESMRKMLAGLPLEIVGIREVLGEIPAVDETGNDPLENAALKAEAYHALLSVPVFSCDSGLFIDGLPPERQPGVHVRTVGGRYLSDDEMIAHYSSLAKELGGRCAARYRNAICLILDPARVFRSMEEALSGERFLLCAVPHAAREAGFPLNSLSVEIASGKYYLDLEKKRASSMAPGFRSFFRDALSL